MDVVAGKLCEVQELAPLRLNLPIVVADLRSVLQVRRDEEVSSEDLVRLDVVVEVNAHVVPRLGDQKLVARLEARNQIFDLVSIANLLGQILHRRAKLHLQRQRHRLAQRHPLQVVHDFRRQHRAVPEIFLEGDQIARLVERLEANGLDRLHVGVQMDQRDGEEDAGEPRGVGEAGEKKKPDEGSDEVDASLLSRVLR